MTPSIRRTPTKELVPLRRLTAVPTPLRLVITPRPRLREIFAPVSLSTYLSPDEYCVIRTRLHWLVPCKRIAQAAVGMPLAFLLTFLLGIAAPGAWWLQVILWLGAVSHQCYLAYCVLLWRNDQIVVTDRRILRMRGVFGTTVEDRTLALITDRTFHQSFWGKALNYGTLRIESGGRHDDGATRELIEFLPNPKLVYQTTLA